MRKAKNRFMRLLLFFDLPVETNAQKREYRKFVKYLTSEGYIRVQYSVYSKLCINNDSAETASKKVKRSAPKEGDIRFLVITENQYKNIVDLNDSHSLQEDITTSDRVIMIGGMNDED